MLDQSIWAARKTGCRLQAAAFRAIMADPARSAGWRVHAENYMGAGGRPLAQLRHLAERFPISVHGVGLSIGGEGPLDRGEYWPAPHVVVTAEASQASGPMARHQDLNAEAQRRPQ